MKSKNVVAGLRPRRLLDVGWGSGYLAKLLKMHVPELVVHGIDISNVALQRARPYLDQVWRVDIDKADLPAAAEHYHTVACVEVLVHLYDPDHALQEMAGTLVPGGHDVEQQHPYRTMIPELLRVPSQAMGCANTLLAPRPEMAREDP